MLPAWTTLFIHCRALCAAPQACQGGKPEPAPYYDNQAGDIVTPEVIQLSTNTIGRVRYRTYELAAILDTKRAKNLWSLV